MKKKEIKKKGQAEDFLADLIPSLIIIAIGLFVLSKMHSSEQELVDRRAAQLEGILSQEEKTMAYYLNEKIEIDGKEINLMELISLSHKNEEYKKKAKRRFENIQGRVAPDDPSPLSLCPSREVCLKAKLDYPGDSEPLIVDDGCVGEEKLIQFPTYKGEYITMSFTLDNALDALLCGQSGI